jgi:hypothetical protein
VTHQITIYNKSFNNSSNNFGVVMESTLDVINVLLETFFELDHPRPVAQAVAISGAPNASENNPPGDSFGQLASGLHQTQKTGHVRLENQSPPDHQTQNSGASMCNLGVGLLCRDILSFLCYE